MEWMILPLKKYATFQGRSRRTEYWMFVLFNWLVGVFAGAVDALLGLTPFGINVILTFALFVPSLAVWVRRLHDVNWSGWWILGVFAPLAVMFYQAIGHWNDPLTNGGVVLFVIVLIFVILHLVLAMLPGSRGTNRFGPDPKNPEADLESVFS